MIDTANKAKLFTLEKLQEKEISHQIINLKPRDRNIELRVIVLELLDTYKTKLNENLMQFLIADNSGSIIANFFGETGQI